MSFGRLKTRLRALINRKDFTDELAGDFVLDAIAILERELRIGAMEKVVDSSVWDGNSNVFFKPPDFIETIAFFTDDGEMTQLDLHQFIEADPPAGLPLYYTAVGDRWLLKPTPTNGDIIYLHYYHETPRPSADSDETVWTESAVQATLYKAAELAADFYQMEPDRVVGYATRAAQYAEQIAAQALDEHWSGRLVVPPPTNTGEF